MNIAVAYPDRIIVDLTRDEALTIEAALREHHRDQQRDQTPFGCRIETLFNEFLEAYCEMGRQKARAYGIIVEGDQPITQGGF